MSRIPTVRLRRKSDGKEIIVNQSDYGRDLGAWKGWKLVGETHGGEPAAQVASEPTPGEPKGWLDMTWFELRAGVKALEGVEKAPKNKAEALTILRDRGLIEGD